jgi:hypothetical protein
VSEWIDVEDRLPEQGQVVIAAVRFVTRGTVATMRKIVRFNDGEFDTLAFWLWGERYRPSHEVPSRDLAGNAPYWMPLPEPPK